MGFTSSIDSEPKISIKMPPVKIEPIETNYQGIRPSYYWQKPDTPHPTVWNASPQCSSDWKVTHWI
jgi:predicted DNA-binding protein (MmcQ/YjbR family)